MEVVTQTPLDPNLITIFVKIVTIILMILYGIFALLIVRQVELMGKTLITPVSKVVSAVAIIHAGFAIGFALLTFFIL